MLPNLYFNRTIEIAHDEVNIPKKINSTVFAKLVYGYGNLFSVCSVIGTLIDLFDRPVRILIQNNVNLWPIVKAWTLVIDVSGLSGRFEAIQRVVVRTMLKGKRHVKKIVHLLTSTNINSPQPIRYTSSHAKWREKNPKFVFRGMKT